MIFIAGMRLMSIWLLAYHLYHYAQREIRSTRENARLSLIAKDAQLNNLVAQLNPHFLFNSLNNIKALVAENPPLARRAIDLLSELLRTSLARQTDTEGSSSTADSGLVAIRDELSMVNDYLELEKMRFEERLQIDVDVAPELLSTMIIPFSIQLLVENGIKHGIDNLKKGGQIGIKIERVGGFVKIQVSNPGKLGASGSSNGVGLKNLKERLNLRYNNAATFDIKERSEMVLATILIPIL